MSYIDLYDKNVMDVVNLGRTTSNFQPSLGDYIKVQIYTQDDLLLRTLYSNKLMLRDQTGNIYLGNYHYHPENPDGYKMGFCSDRYHSDKSKQNLKPILFGGATLDDYSTLWLDSTANYKKQVSIYRDDKGEIYIKPNEIIKQLNLGSGKWKVKTSFERDLTCNMGSFFNIMKGNLIENGNFFAGLESTQAGDIDRSVGKNDIVMFRNPGFSKFCLCQNGVAGNEYIMKVTGIQPNKLYMFSCWVAWDSNYNGQRQMVHFDNVSSESTPENPKVGLPTVPQTNLAGSFLTTDTPQERNLLVQDINGVNWYKRYSLLATDGNADLGYMFVHLGRNGNGFLPSTNPLGKRYFTDLRLTEIPALETQTIQQAITWLKEDASFVPVIKQDSMVTTNGEVTHEGETTVPSGDYSYHSMYDAPIIGEDISKFAEDQSLSLSIGEILNRTFPTEDTTLGDPDGSDNAGDDVGILEYGKGGRIKRNRSRKR